jgi:geranylgeranyl diphosphate synthase type I
MRNELKSSEVKETRDANKGYEDRLAKMISGGIYNAISCVENESLRTQLRYCMEPPGHLYRSKMALMITDALNGNPKSAIPFGLSLEFIQTFSLIHDDIMDRSDLRRGKPTAYKEYGLNSAILLGDAFFAMAFEAVDRLETPDGRKEKLADLLARSTFQLADGQMMDIGLEGSTTLPSVGDYMKMIGLKTASLFSVAAEGAGVIAGVSPSTRKDLREFGRLIGLSYQIKDDIEDLRDGIRNEVGRNVLVIDAFVLLDDKKSFRLMEVLRRGEKSSKAEIDEVYDFIIDSGAPEKAERRIVKCTERAKDIALSLPCKAGRQRLVTFIDKVFPFQAKDDEDESEEYGVLDEI